MKMKKILLSISALCILILELLPNGVILNFANPDGEPFRSDYSYFSMTPFGYANFGPLLTAILTVVLVILTAIYLIKPSKKLNFSLSVISAVAAVTSLMPFMFGFDFISVIGVLITVLLCCFFAITKLGKDGEIK